MFVLAVVLLLAVSPFLPGPGSLSGFTITVYNLLLLATLPMLLLIPVGIFWLYRRNKPNVKTGTKQTLLLPNLLWITPLILSIIFYFFTGPLRQESRKTAIKRASALIAGLERYKSDKGVYPNSILELAPQYTPSVPSPGIMGIPGYDYSKIDDSYEIKFTQTVLAGWNYEVVSFSSNNTHQPDNAPWQPTKYTGWKYFIFD